MDAANTWTDERVELLRKLWASGKSASQIAALIGGVTRNAVIGKVHRLGLSGRGKVKAASHSGTRRAAAAKTASATPARSAPRAVSAKATAPQIERVEIVPVRPVEVVIPPSERVALVDLRDSMCRWPIGDPTTPEFGFCGGHAASSLPYCTYHCQIAYHPVAERRRDRKAS